MSDTPQAETPCETEVSSPHQPDFTLSPLDITTYIIPEDELPESIYEFANISTAYSSLKKENIIELLNRYPTTYYFNQFLQAMYKRARIEGKIRYYEHAGKKSVDFPVENEMNNDRLFASFLPNKNREGNWFFLGIRKGGKIHDFAYPGKRDANYSHMQHLTDLEAVSINSKNELQTYLEDAFLKAAEEHTIYQYTIGENTMVEYPTGLYRTVDNTTSIITAIYNFNLNKKWTFKSFRFRETEHELPESIRLDEIGLWRRAERAKRKEEKKQRKAEHEEYRYKLNEARKSLIPFEPFPIKKIQPEITADYYGELNRFAYINKSLYLYIPEAGIKNVDDEEIHNNLRDSFKACNPYADIDYYHTASEGDIAELRISIPQNPDKEIYAVFTRNINPQKQPWYFKRFEYKSKFHRMIDLGNIEEVFEQLNSIISDTSREHLELTCAEALEAHIQKRFNTAISKEDIYVYGTATSKHAELPLHLRSKDGEKILAHFLSNGKTAKWRLTEFKRRVGGDLRILISNEYKAECAEKQAALERRDIEKYTKEESREPVSSEKESAKKDCTVKEQGTQVLGTDGKPISLIDFCKEINNRPLHLLSLMAEEEVWGFSETEPFEILYKYLNAQFIRLGYEKKLFVRYTREGTPKYAVIHTGLFTRELHEPIYAGFKAIPQFSQNYTGQLWRLDGFCCKSEGGSIYDNITKHFTEFPENVDFMRENGEYIPLNHYVLDLKEPITLKEEHILKERGYRLPTDFLRNVFRFAKDQKAKEYLQKLETLTTEEERKDFWINTFSDYLENTPSTYDKLLQRLQIVVEEAQTSNIRRPLPTYYPRDNKITWLLPLRFHEESDLKNLALVVGLRDSGGYKGITLMNIEYVYHRVRVIENPDRSWLKTEILDNYVIDPSILLSIGEEEADYVSETYGVYDE